MSKLKSRKFLVWITWLVISGVSLFQGDLPKETIFEFFGLVSLVYIGANSAQKYIFSRFPKP